jgi:hypothetical protein
VGELLAGVHAVQEVVVTQPEEEEEKEGGARSG